MKLKNILLVPPLVALLRQKKTSSLVTNHLDQIGCRSWASKPGPERKNMAVTSLNSKMAGAIPRHDQILPFG
jgi:hypothetical protein